MVLKQPPTNSKHASENISGHLTLQNFLNVLLGQFTILLKGCPQLWIASCDKNCVELGLICSPFLLSSLCGKKFQHILSLFVRRF